MTKQQKLYKGISKAAMGFFFVFFNFSINKIDLLPSFIGYLFFLSAIEYLKEEERDLSLLRIMGIMLFFWNLVHWILCWFDVYFIGFWKFIVIVFDITELYFLFQMLTDLSSIARRYQPENYLLDKKIIVYRTIETIITTIITGVWFFSVSSSPFWILISLVLSVISFVAVICIILVLMDLRKIILYNEMNTVHQNEQNGL